MKTETETLISAMRKLAEDIESAAGVANAAVDEEMAYRLDAIQDAFMEVCRNAGQQLLGLCDRAEHTAKERDALAAFADKMLAASFDGVGLETAAILAAEVNP